MQPDRWESPSPPLQEQRDSFDQGLLLIRLKANLEGLEFKLQTSSNLSKEIPVVTSTLVFVASLTGFLVTLLLAMAPYLSISSIQSAAAPQIRIPLAISYVSAFAVLFFAYLTHASFRSMAMQRNSKRIVRLAIMNAESIANRARTIYARAEEETRRGYAADVA